MTNVVTKKRQELVLSLARQFVDIGVETVLLGGSVLRGDVIPLSDLDLFLVMDYKDELESYKELASCITWPSVKEIHQVGLCDIQARFYHSNLKSPDGLLKVIGGKTMQIDWYTDDELLRSAEEGFRSLGWKRYYLEYLLHAGSDWSIRLPRLVSIDVFPMLRYFLIISGWKPTPVWQMFKQDVISVVDSIKPQWGISAYYDQLVDLRPSYPDTNHGLQCALAGIDVLKCISEDTIVE